MLLLSRRDYSPVHRLSLNLLWTGNKNRSNQYWLSPDSWNRAFSSQGLALHCVVLCAVLTVVLIPPCWLLLCQMPSLANPPVASWHQPYPSVQKLRASPWVPHDSSWGSFNGEGAALACPSVPIRLCKMSLSVTCWCLPSKCHILLSWSPLWLSIFCLFYYFPPHVPQGQLNR